MKLLFTLKATACLCLLAGTGLSGCTTKEEVPPATADCATIATVRLCPGRTIRCDTEHTSLVLPDGTLLRPMGPLWAAYQRNQQNGQVLRIGYQITSRPAFAEEGFEYVLLTCLDQNITRCATNL
jgi:hypothetical protein